ncbi:MAG: aminopeptidase [Calditrichia bacterium]|nr:aminopeptidase [Calditrichia bacterium]
MKNLPSIVTILFLIIIGFSSLWGQSARDIDSRSLEKLRTSFKMDATDKALQNAISNNDINNLVLNREMVNQHNELFNVKIDAKGITNQKSTGRCWMFAGLNILRPAMLKKYNLSDFEFSQSYLFFWDKLEKFNYFLEAIIETRDKPIDDRELQALLDSPIGDGGWWTYYTALIEKYGAIPKENMPETVNSEKSKMMNKTIQYLALQDASILRKQSANGLSVKKLRESKFEMLQEAYKILAYHLGVPPKQFNWRYSDKDDKITDKRYTPQEFYKDVIGINLKDYVTIFNHPVHPFDKYYQVKFRRNMADGIYQYDALFGIEYQMSKAERIQYGVSAANHAMAFIGADTIEGKPSKWRVENSWGTDLGDKGYWTMYDNWFDAYVFTLIIHKKYLPEKVLAILKTKPTILPTWEPLAKSLDEMGQR